MAEFSYSQNRRTILLLGIIALLFGCAGKHSGSSSFSTPSACELVYLEPGEFQGNTTDLRDLIVGKTLNIPSGWWAIDEALHLFAEDSGLHIVGAGQGQTFLYHSGTWVGSVVSLMNATDVTVEGLTIVGNLRSSTLGHCLRGAGAAGFQAIDVTVRECGTYGFGFQKGVHTWDIDDLSVSPVFGNQVGVRFRLGAEGATASNLDITLDRDNPGIGIHRE